MSANPLLRRLRHHVTGAIERGESEPVIGIPAERLHREWLDGMADEARAEALAAESLARREYRDSFADAGYKRGD